MITSSLRLYVRTSGLALGLFQHGAGSAVSPTTGAGIFLARLSALYPFNERSAALLRQSRGDHFASRAGRWPVSKAGLAGFDSLGVCQ